MSTAITLPQTAELMRQATDVAGVCKEIVLRTAMEIQGRKFVRVEGWQSIATAHGCVASIREVRQTEDGTAATAELKRISDGAVLASAEGYVGSDEPTWYGGEIISYGKTKTLPKRADFAIRAMAQTRAISRVCRSAFAHVVVLMDAGLQTTPAEEMSAMDVHAEPAAETKAPERAKETPREQPAASAHNDGAKGWRTFEVPKFIKKYAGATLGDMEPKDIAWWANHYEPKPYRGEVQQRDIDFKAALQAAKRELAGEENPDLDAVPAGDASDNEGAF